MLIMAIIIKTRKDHIGDIYSGINMAFNIKAKFKIIKIILTTIKK